MKFDFEVDSLFSVNEEGFGQISASNFKPGFQIHSKPSFSSSTNKNISRNYTVEKQLKKVVDTMGLASSKAQGLKTVITSLEKILDTNNRIQVKANGNQVFGFLKVGEKNLFYRDRLGQIKEITPICVLDFYVVEEQQRCGIGKAIFEWMLAKENTVAQCVAQDRPSPKLLAFLKKQQNLAKFEQQNNNFVIFDLFFEKSQLSKKLLKQSNENNSNTKEKKSSENCALSNKINSTPSENEYKKGKKIIIQSKFDTKDFENLCQPPQAIDIKKVHKFLT